MCGTQEHHTHTLRQLVISREYHYRTSAIITGGNLVQSCFRLYHHVHVCHVYIGTAVGPWSMNIINKCLLDLRPSIWYSMKVVKVGLTGPLERIHARIPFIPAILNALNFVHRAVEMVTSSCSMRGYLSLPMTPTLSLDHTDKVTLVFVHQTDLNLVIEWCGKYVRNTALSLSLSLAFHDPYLQWTMLIKLP